MGHSLETRQSREALINLYKTSFTEALPSHIKPETMIRAMLTALDKNPSLTECEPHSVIACCFEATQLGLIPDNFMGECHMIPYNNKRANKKIATFIVGYKGLIKLAKRTGEVKSIHTQCAYEGDDFMVIEGVNRDIHHIKKNKSDKVTHAYAVIKFTNGGFDFEVMDIGDIEKIRQASKSPDGGAWTTYYGEMAKKSVLRRLLKRQTLSSELQKAIGIDENNMVGKLPEHSFNFDVDKIPAKDRVLVEGERQDYHEELQEEEKEARVAKSEKKTKSNVEGTLKSIEKKTNDEKADY